MKGGGGISKTSEYIYVDEFKGFNDFLSENLNIFEQMLGQSLRHLLIFIQ